MFIQSILLLNSKPDFIESYISKLKKNYEDIIFELDDNFREEYNNLINIEYENFKRMIRGE